MRKIPCLVIISLFCLTSLFPAVNSIYIEKIINCLETSLDNGLMDSCWPMECHGLHHNSHSQYNTAGNPPVAEILYPENGSTIYTKYTNLSVKFTDDIGLTYVEVSYGGDWYEYGYGTSVHPPSKIFYFNKSLTKMYPGYVWIVAKAFDEDGNIGNDTAIFYYDDTNDSDDLYPPEIDIWRPLKGQIHIFGELLPRYFDRINCSIVIGKFEIISRIDDPEEHLQEVEMYIDDKVVYKQEISDGCSKWIIWNCNKFLIGMHEIKIVAIDSYNHSSMEKLNCFIINFS